MVPQGGARIWGQVGPEDEPPDNGGFAIRGLRLIRGIAPFDALWLRADTAPTTVTVYQGNSMSGVVYFGKSPFRLRASGPVKIEVPYVPQILDGGAPDTRCTARQPSAYRSVHGPISCQVPRTCSGAM